MWRVGGNKKSRAEGGRKDIRISRNGQEMSEGRIQFVFGGGLGIIVIVRGDLVRVIAQREEQKKNHSLVCVWHGNWHIIILNGINRNIIVELQSIIYKQASGCGCAFCGEGTLLSSGLVRWWLTECCIIN